MTERNLEKPKLFVSFARGEFRVSRLFERLEAQSLEVWNYDRPSETVPLGVDLKEYLTEQMERSDVCLVVVSPEVFDNEVICYEVNQALTLQKNGNLKICVFEDMAQAKLSLPWKEPFDELKDKRYAIVDLDDPVSLSDAVSDLCARLDIPYHPSFTEAEREPLIARFYQELTGAIPRETARENDLFQYLVRLLEQAHEAERAENIDTAHRVLQLAIGLTEHEYPLVRLYYPSVIRALHLAQSGDPVGARDMLLALDKQVGPDEGFRSDACLPSALGYIYYQLGDFVNAAICYEQAIGLSHSDVADYTSLLLSKLRMGEEENLEEHFSRIDMAPRLEGDEPKMAYSKALALRLAGRLDEAAYHLGHWLETYPEHSLFDEVLEEYTRVLLTLGVPHDAEKRLRESIQAGSSSPIVRRSLAKLLSLTGGDSEARHLYVQLITDAMKSLETAFEVLCGLWKLGATDDARSGAKAFLEKHSHPDKPFEYYVAGAANYILGETDRADHDFFRSGEQTHYRDYLKNSN